MTEETRRRGLGRGLSALLADDGEDVATLDRLRTVRDLPIESLRPGPYQPRRSFDEEELQQLAESIARRGLLQPIVVRRQKDVAADASATYEIVAGERRWRAAQIARLHEVPAIIRDLSDAETLEVALVENLQRQDLTALEEAHAYRRLIDEFGHSQEALAEAIGRSRSHVANTLRLLTLPEAVRDLLAAGKLTAGHARALVGAEEAAALAERVVGGGLNVRQTEALARKARPGGPQPSEPKGREKSADIRALEDELSEKLGLAVALATGRGEAGELRIRYRTLEQLEDVCRRLTSG